MTSLMTILGLDWQDAAMPYVIMLSIAGVTLIALVVEHTMEGRR